MSYDVLHELGSENAVKVRLVAHLPLEKTAPFESVGGLADI